MLLHGHVLVQKPETSGLFSASHTRLVQPCNPTAMPDPDTHHQKAMIRNECAIPPMTGLGKNPHPSYTPLPAWVFLQCPLACHPPATA